MDKLSQGEADVINNAMPASQANKPLGNRIKEIEDYGLVIVPLEVTENSIDFVMPFRMRIANVVVRCTATKGQGKMMLKRVETGITSNIDCATKDRSYRAATIVSDQADIVAGETLNVQTVQNARGILYIVGYKI